jgi:tetratricopeptide (TPR) repeat protein
MRASCLGLVTLVLLAAPSSARADAVADGKKALAERRFVAAAEAFRAAVKATPTNREAVVGLAKAAAEGKVEDVYGEATGALSAHLKGKPDDREARLAYGYLFLARAVVDERYRADAQEQFQKLLASDPADDQAAVGLARYYFFGGEYPKAIATLDAALAKKPKSAAAHFWRGMAFYDPAEQGSRAGMTPAVVDSFQKAAAAFQAATEADPARHDAWMRLAYAHQYLVGVDPANEAKAEAAYLKALDVDPSDDAPLRGLASLHARQTQRYADVLARLSKEKASSPAVLHHVARDAAWRGRFDEAIEALKKYVAGARNPARGWYELGELLRTKKNDEEGARKAYRKALELDPTFPEAEVALQWLVVPLHEKGRDAVGDAAAARAIQKEYEALIALAPKRASGPHNDVAFFLREAYGATGQKHRDLLDASIAHYVAASDLVGELMPGDENLPYPRRHDNAQVLNDTGLMFFFYPEVQDLRRAEKYYRRAMDWTDYGYWDAYGNMMKLLEREGRHEDAAAFAESCAEGIKTPEGNPQETFRRIAAADAERIRKMLGK